MSVVFVSIVIVLVRQLARQISVLSVNSMSDMETGSGGGGGGGMSETDSQTSGGATASPTLLYVNIGNTLSAV